jgi:acyl carrier protein
MATTKRKDEIFPRLQKVLAEFLKVSTQQIKLDSDLREDLGVDSVDYWEIIAKVEKEFHIEFAEDKPPFVTTVKDVLCAIEARL